MATYIPLECYVCKKMFSGPIPAQDHFRSHEHNKKKKASKQELPGIACHVCNVSCSTMLDLEKHVQSPRHKANSEKQQKFQAFGNELTTGSLNYAELLDNTGEVYEFSVLSNLGYCYLCKCDFNSRVHAQSHLNGKPHKKKYAQYQASMSALTNTSQQNGSNFSARDQFQDSRSHMPDISQGVEIVQNNSLCCEICGVSFTGQENLQQHYASDKHRKQVVLKEKRDRGEELPLKCDICSCSFTGQESAQEHFQSKKHKRNKENMNIQSETTHTGSSSSVNLNASKQYLHVMPELETVVQQNNSSHLSKLMASPKQETYINLPSSVKPLPGKTKETPMDPTTHLFQYAEGNQNNSNYDIHKLQDANWKCMMKEEFNDNLQVQPGNGQQVSNSEKSPLVEEDELIIKPIENDEENLANRQVKTENYTKYFAQNNNERNDFKQINTENVTHGEHNDDSLFVKPEYDSHCRQTKKKWLDSDTEIFHSMSEIKIKAETYTSNEQQFKPLDLTSGEFSSRDTEPIKYVNNNLGQSLAPIGRGRGIFTMLKAENLPRKVDNTCENKLMNEYPDDDSETWKKSAWPEVQVGDRSDLENDADFMNENGDRSYNIPPHIKDNNDGYPTVSSSPTNTFHENNGKRETVNSSKIEEYVFYPRVSPKNVFSYDNGVKRENVSSSKFEEFVFDPITGRGKCYICDIDFTSSKHKSQHILGKNHLKAREVHRGLINVGETACGSLICKICSVTFSGPEAKQQHMESEKHKRKEMRHLAGEENDYYCDICKISCSGPESFTQHRLGAQHRKLAGLSNADDHGLNMPNYDQTRWYPCEICKCAMNTYEQLKIHERSPKHLKQLEKQVSSGIISHDRTQWFPCKVCNVSMNTYEQLRIHEQSPRHIKELEKQMPCGLQNSDRTQWFPCKICNVSMNTLGQLKIHEQSPKHLKQLEKRMESGSVSPHDRTIWYPCNVCNCNMNTQEQLRIHEASPAHIAKLRKFNNIQQLTPSFTPATSMTDISVSPESTTPLESFLSQELFPEEFLPQSDVTVNNNDTKPFEDYFQEQLVVTDKPFNTAPRFALIPTEKMERGTTNSQSTGGTKRGIGSDLAFATRNRGTRENSNRQGGSSPHLDPNETNSQDRRPLHCVSGQVVSENLNQKQSTILKMSPTENNPYAATHRYYCHTCKAPMNTKESYENHVRGKRHMQKVCIEQAPQRCHYAPVKLSEDYLPYTKTKPRNYQQELYKKTMVGNTLCFLPTGTGKTLVSVMTMSAMLEKHPSKNVLFLVDKVLLVLQQSKYIKSELEEKEFYRFNPDSVNVIDLQKRKLQIAALCMGQQTTNGIPLWKHDVLVVTAAFCQNLLDKQVLKWEDFSLIVFDEAHHCEKGHPFNTLLTTYHRRTLPVNRPKVLGLTASPAGKIDVPKTLHMLRGLVSNMGDVSMTIVEEHENVDTLNEYQSNADMIIRPQLAPSDLMESGLRQELNTYIMHCLLKLYQVSNIKWYLDFERVPSTNMSDDEVKQVADDFVEKNFDMIQSSLNMIDHDTDSAIGKAEFYHLCMHVQSICMTLSCLEEGGVLIALSELEELESTEFNLSFARGLGLPTAPLQQIVARQGAGLGGQDENSSSSLHMQRLIDELTEGISVDNDVRRISLVLVKQRCTAHLITKVLQKSDRMRKLGLNTTCVVGHGGSGAADKGMNVNQQKRVLEEIKEYQYQVIVATSVAEEGVDMPECERVISLYPPSTVTALVQMRGRARRKNSKFIVLCSSPDEEAKLYDIIQREKNMIAATHLLMQEKRKIEDS